MTTKFDHEIHMAEDGFRYYCPPNDCGFFAAHTLREIADRLDEMNKGWNEIIEADLATCPCCVGLDDFAPDEPS